MRLKWWVILFLVVGFVVVKYLDLQSVSTSIPQKENKKGGDFTLKGPLGDWTLSESGKEFNLIYFGYTFCPDVCPTSLMFLAGSLKKLNPAQLNRVQSILISVDPARDTVERLQEYVTFFHPTMIGLTGSLEELKKIATRYGAIFHIHESEREKVNYSVDHSSLTYLVDRSGKILYTFPHATKSSEIYQKLMEYL